MAPKTPKNTQPQTPAEEAKPFFQRGQFAFTKMTGMAIPETAKAARFSPESPFSPFFVPFAEFANNEAFDVPFSFFTLPAAKGGIGDRPGVRADTVIDGAYIKDKIRGAFTGWKKKNPEASKGRSLILVERKRGDDDGRGNSYTVPTMTVFLQVAAPAPAPEPAPADRAPGEPGLTPEEQRKLAEELETKDKAPATE